VIPKISTDEGRMISTKPVPLNAPFSIRDNIDSDSKIIEESDLQPEKQLSHTLTGTYKISDSSRPQNLHISSPILAIASVNATTTFLLFTFAHFNDSYLALFSIPRPHSLPIRHLHMSVRSQDL
jgi:hypothetical protein